MTRGKQTLQKGFEMKRVLTYLAFTYGFALGIVAFCFAAVALKGPGSSLIGEVVWGVLYVVLIVFVVICFFGLITCIVIWPDFIQIGRSDSNTQKEIR